MATAGPKTSHVAAAAGSERAEGPTPQPQPRYSMRRDRLESTCARSTPANKNGVASKNALADAVSAERTVSGENVIASAAVATPKSRLRTRNHHAYARNG